MEKINYIEEKPAFALLNKRLKEYEARSSKNTDIKKTGIYLRYILHYVYKLADNEAYPRFENYLMLASCHTKANGGSALINSAAEAAADYPDDDIFSTGPKLINSMTDKDMDAVISFLEWDVTDAHLKKDEHTKKDKESKEKRNTFCKETYFVKSFLVHGYICCRIAGTFSIAIVYRLIYGEKPAV